MFNAIYRGGAPIIADSPALDLSNTIYTPRGHERDGLCTLQDVVDWLAIIQPRLQTGTSRGPGDVTESDLIRIRGLRASMRRLLYSICEGDSPSEADVATVNAAACLSPQWFQLKLKDGRPARYRASDSQGIDAVLAALASDAIDLVGSERVEDLRTCQAHNCSLLFLKDHPRREWCSPKCGARVRAARAYSRRKTAI